MEGCARKWHFSDESEKTHVKGHRQGRVSRGAVSIWRPRGPPRSRRVHGRDINCHDWHHVVWRTSGIAGSRQWPRAFPQRHRREYRDRNDGPRCIDQSAYHSPTVLHLRHYARNEDTNPIRPIVGNFETQRRPNCGFRLRAKRQSRRGPYG
jgi:hypothetical protein